MDSPALATLTRHPRALRDGFDFRARSHVSPLRRLVYTLLICPVIAALFTLLTFAINGRADWRDGQAWLRTFGANLVVALAIGLAIYALFALLIPAIGAARIERWSHHRRWLFFSAVPLLGVAIGWPLGLTMIGVDVAGAIGSRSTDGLVRSLLMFALVSIVFNLYFGARARQSEAEQQASEAQLRLLQGQIEPHFLFNTLANVIALIDHDAPRAKAMLESFTDYLRASLTGLRAGDATLGSEIDLARAYLELLALRMEDRLRYEIDCDAALRDAALPSLLLQPLVENAIHHGLEPKVDGGTVRVTARREGRLLVVAVTDDGLGLAAPPRRKAGAGLALANLRERLHARYGREATLTLAAAAPGTVATLRLPIEQASAR